MNNRTHLNINKKFSEYDFSSEELLHQPDPFSEEPHTVNPCFRKRSVKGQKITEKDYLDDIPDDTF